MTISIKHQKNSGLLPDWTQTVLDDVIAGNAPPLPPSGTLLSNIVLPSDFAADHVIDTAGASDGDVLTVVSGAAEWATPSGGGSPGGSSGQMQWNNSGSFAGAAFSTVATSGTHLTLTAQAATDVPMVVKGAASQTANLHEWQDSFGTVKSYIKPDGGLNVPSSFSYLYWAAVGTFPGAPDTAFDLNVGNYGMQSRGIINCARTGAAVSYANRAFDFSGWGWIQLDPTYNLVFASYTTGEAIRIIQNGGVKITGNTELTAPIKMAAYTVATLPAGNQGDRCYVTDALAPTFLTALTGGGAAICPAFYNGTAWVAG